VGPKTAVKWISEHGDLEGVLAAADRIQPERFRDQIRAEADRIRGNLQLVTFRTDFPFEPGEQPREDAAGVETFLAEMEMHSTLRRYQAKGEKGAAESKPAPVRKSPPPASSQGELF
jgi:DNA polymerase-1